MKGIRGILRALLGLTFLFSGFVKIIDPVGSGMIMGEYLKFMHLSYFDFAAPIASSIMASLEMLTGIALLVGLRMRTAIVTSLILISFFTLLTLFLAIFNPILDCGCFGEAIKLSNIDTFLKNLVLLAIVLVLYFQRNNFISLAPVKIEWIFLGVFAMLITLLSIYSHYNLPVIDFLEYKSGYDLKDSGVQNNASNSNLETVLIYRKGNEVKEFSINKLPDSTWKFVDSRTTQKNDTKFEWSVSNFSITNENGEYVTDSIVNLKGPLFIFTILNMEKLSNYDFLKLREKLEGLNKHNIKSLILTSSSLSELIPELLKSNIFTNVYFVDFKTLVAMNRSNMGVIYVDGGVIIKKWVLRYFNADKSADLIGQDSELISAEVNIRQQINVEIIAVAFLLLLLMMRFIFKLIFIKKMTHYADRIEEEFTKS